MRWKSRGSFYRCRSIPTKALPHPCRLAAHSHPHPHPRPPKLTPFRPQISECAIVGLPSTQWGQKVAAVIVLDPAHANSGRGGKQWGVMDMRRALKERLAAYKIPQEMKVVEAVPRNAMGKGES